MSIDQDTSWSVRWWLLMFSCSQCWCELLAMTHPPHHAASGGVQRYYVSTITLAKLFTTLFVKGELKENWSNIPICVWMIALSCCTRETLHYSNKCTMFARAIKRVDAGHRTQTCCEKGGYMQIQLLSAPVSGGQTDCIISIWNVNPMLFTLEMYSKTNMVNLNNKKPGNAWPGVCQKWILKKRNSQGEFYWL